MTISLDYTTISVVVLCTDCPWWAGAADSKLEGWKVGTAHQARVHPGAEQAAAALASCRRSLARQSTDATRRIRA